MLMISSMPLSTLEQRHRGGGMFFGSSGGMTYDTQPRGQREQVWCLPGCRRRCHCEGEDQDQEQLAMVADRVITLPGPEALGSNDSDGSFGWRGMEVQMNNSYELISKRRGGD
ncbi:hypothetical protein BS78_03G307100 [Paspalum vaginatum]|nr:hypothetical protein BS78_03G307100 [Paspalum vaginatum]